MSIFEEYGAFKGIGYTYIRKGEQILSFRVDNEG